MTWPNPIAFFAQLRRPNPSCDTVPVELQEALPDIVRVAQAEYDAWQQDNDGYDEEVGGGGICHLIADRISEILTNYLEIPSTTVSSTHEVHVYVVAKLPSGVWLVDIRPENYERGGGYTWTKIEGVVFDASDVTIDRLSRDPEDFEREYCDDK
jgi:hypothetical protein